MRSHREFLSDAFPSLKNYDNPEWSHEFCHAHLKLTTGSFSVRLRVPTVDRTTSQAATVPELDIFSVRSASDKNIKWHA